MKYEKPLSIDAGHVAAIQGATCSPGSYAADGCTIGTNPASVYECPQGNIADTNCDPVGGAAGSWCSDGQTPRAGRCANGGTEI